MVEALDAVQARGSLADEAYAAIRRAILRCDLVPGDQISEVQLSEGFGFNRAAVRAALIRLCHERLLIAIPRQGYQVAALTIKGVQDLFGMRRLLEPAAAGLAAASGGNGRLVLLDELNDACMRTERLEDPAALREANKVFHVGLAHASGNERLADMTSVVLDEMDRALYLPELTNVWERIDATFEEHRRIIEAVQARNVAAAERAALDHIQLNERFVIDVLIAGPQLRSINLAGARRG